MQKVSWVLLVILLLSSIGFAGEQRPPLPVDPDEECHIVDAKPLLDKSKYADAAGYTLTYVNKNPLTLSESIKLEDNSRLGIEQRGCEDIYFKFTFEDAQKKSQSAVERVKKLADILSNLKLSQDTLLSAKKLSDIAGKVKSRIARVKNPHEFTVCLMSIPSECITDFKVTVKPSEIEFYYVDRP